MRTALVLVSHSARAAEGAAEIARQMAPDVWVVAAGGADEGIGTSFDRVLSALEGVFAEGAPGVVVLTDLGSAVLTSQAVVETLDDDLAARVRVPDAPFVEGAVVAAVEAQQGGDLDAVAAAAIAAGAQFATTTTTSGATGDGAADAGLADAGTAHGGAGDDVHRETVALRNPLGLHARPAALLARAVTDSGVAVRIGGADGRSVLELMALGATGGQELVVEARGPGAREAVDHVTSVIEGGFGEA